LPSGVDVLCHKCGYNLRGLVEGGRCPECAAVIRLDIPRAEWTRWRITLTCGVVAIVVLLMALNVLFTAHPEWISQGHLQVALLFQRIWLGFGGVTIMLGLIAETQRRIPSAMWIALWTALAASAVGWILNGLVEVMVDLRV